MNPPKLYRVIMPVNDIEKASLFYQEVLQIKGERVSLGPIISNVTVQY